MKIKLKQKDVKLPNCWKTCGVSYEDWQELQSGKGIEASFVPEYLESMIEVIKSTQKKGNK